MARSVRRRTIVAALAASLLVLPVPAAVADHPGPCALHRAARESTGQFVKRLIRCAVTRWPVDGGAEKAICIAKRESGLNPRATSEPKGLYAGLYQHSVEFWPYRLAKWTRRVWELSDEPLNARSNVIVTIRWVHADDSWGPWMGPGC